MTVPTFPGGPFIVDTRLATSFKIDGFELLTVAWHIDVKPFLNSPPARGSDVVIDGKPGERPYRRLRGKPTLSVDLPINGFVTSSGTPNSNPATGFETNLNSLRNYCDPIASGNGTRTAVITLPSGTTRTGKLTPLGIELGAMVGFINAAKFHLSLPDGWLA